MIVFLLYKKTDPLHMSRYEDQIISWTWNRFIESNGSDPTILLQLPMTKVR
jgi:PhoPQ-activated pathogenicity-related protein